MEWRGRVYLLSRIDVVSVSECCATSRKKLTSRGRGFKVNSTFMYLLQGGEIKWVINTRLRPQATGLSGCSAERVAILVIVTYC